MTKTLHRFAPGLLAAALAAGSGVALVSIAHAQGTAPVAATATTPSPTPTRPAMEPGGPGRHGGRMMRELDRFKTSLKLTPSQTALWDRAVEQMKPPTDLREKMRSRREQMNAMLDDPNFDPRKLAAAMDSDEAERKAKMTSVRDAWFAVYDSLNPVQRGQAREFLRSHVGRPMMHGGHRGHDGPGGHGGPGDGGRDAPR